MLIACSKTSEGVTKGNAIDRYAPIAVEIGPTNGLSEKDYLFGFSWGSKSEYYEPMPEMIQQACSELGIPMAISESPDNWIQTEQNKCLDNMINDGARGIFMMTSEPNSGNLKINEMVSEGIPVVCLGGAPTLPTESTLTLATDVYQCSYDATLALLEAMNYKGNIVAITGAETDTNSNKRLQAVDDACKQYGNVEILVSQKGIYSPESGLEIVGNVLEEYGDRIDGVVAMDYYAAYAMAYYLLNDDIYSDIICVGLDSDKLVLKAIEEGKMLGSMSQNPWAQAYLGVYTLKMLKDGWTYKTGQPYMVDTGNFLITKDNIKDYASIAKKKTSEIASSWANRFNPPARLIKAKIKSAWDTDGDAIPTRITAIIPQSSNEYWKLFAQGLLDNVGDNMSTKIDLCQETDVNQQLEKLDTAIAANVDYVVLYPTEDERFIDSIEKATNKGIKVILVESDIVDSARSAYIGCDNYEAGQLAARAMIETSDKRRNIAIVGGNKEQSQQNERARGFTDEIYNNSDHKIVCIEYSNADSVQATEKMQYILKAYPQTNAFLVLSSTDTDSVVRTVQGKINRDTYSIIAFNGAELTEYYINGNLVKAIIETDPYQLGKETGELIIKMDSGQENNEPKYSLIKVNTRDILE